jgi:uncharacterized protein YecE (DUF72 family)
MLARMAEIGGQVEFVLKAYKEMTHETNTDVQIFYGFPQALTPLVQRRSGCVLAQFPIHFMYPRDLDFSTISEFSWHASVVIEFRNHAWFKESPFCFLKDLNYGFCCVDEPQFRIASSVAWPRRRLVMCGFHGRTSNKWWPVDDRRSYVIFQRTGLQVGS